MSDAAQSGVIMMEAISSWKISRERLLLTDM